VNRSCAKFYLQLILVGGRDDVQHDAAVEAILPQVDRYGNNTKAGEMFFELFGR
jgi:hypothetical protein